MKFPRSKKLVFFNNKGGVGKTTLAYNTAVQFANKSYKTVLVDLDPQCNLTRLALGEEYYENTIFSEYLNIMYIPHVGEVTIFIAAMVGALIGFLWYNTYPAQVFMGDTGSLTIGGIIAVLAIMVRKELLIPVLCGIFLMENLSVMLQVAYFKYTKKKYGEGRRIFLMSPLHHHYQKKGYHESKIVMRFLIVGIILALISFITLKIR